MWNDELELEILIGTNIPDRPDHDPIGDIQTQTDLPPHSDAQEDPSPSSSLEFDTMQGSILCFLFPYHIKSLAKSDH